MTPVKRYLPALACFLLTAGSLFAQRKVLSGVLKDSLSEERVPFASISFRNTTVGQLSDSSGLFSFSLHEWPSDTLDITCVGYQPYVVLIDKSKDSIHL